MVTERSYTVVGKVLPADLFDKDKFQNHYLLTSESLGNQLLKTYDLGKDAKVQPASNFDIGKDWKLLF